MCMNICVYLYTPKNMYVHLNVYVLVLQTGFDTQKGILDVLVR